jgi:hypothetical protein
MPSFLVTLAELASLRLEDLLLWQFTQTPPHWFWMSAGSLTGLWAADHSSPPGRQVSVRLGGFLSSEWLDARSTSSRGAGWSSPTSDLTLEVSPQPQHILESQQGNPNSASQWNEKSIVWRTGERGALLEAICEKYNLSLITLKKKNQPIGIFPGSHEWLNSFKNLLT